VEGVTSQIPADCNPEVYDEGFWSRLDVWAGQFGLTGPAGIVQASEVREAGSWPGRRLATALSRLVV
jgi:hypothetical protein